MCREMGSCYNSTTDCLQPLLNNKSAALLDNEAGSDVEFVVGPDGGTWRLPAHRAVLAEASPVFKAMLTGPLSASTTAAVRVRDVDGRAFHQLLKVLYGAQPEIRSEATCLQTLYCANKYLCPWLVVFCIRMLDSKLSTNSVLRVMQTVLPFVPPGQEVNLPLPLPLPTPASTPYAPSAPPASPQHSEPKTLSHNYPDVADDASMGFYSAALLHNCLQFVDAHADQVLESEGVEDLTQEELVLVVSRDSLALEKEAILFSALERWSDRECKRKGLRLCPDNMRAVLGEAIWAVRYLRMSADELLAGPVKSGLLDATETSYLLGEVLKTPQVTPAHLVPHKEWLSKERPKANPNYMPLSDRTNLPNILAEDKCADDDAKDRLETRKEKKARKKIDKLKKREEWRQSRERCVNCFVESFFYVLARIFD